MTTVFILAGFDLHHTAATERYTILENGLRQKGYKIVAVDIAWKRKTPSKYANEFVQFYKANKTKKNIVIGNSFGAVIGLISAVHTKPDELYLCSISPFFKEDYGKYPDNYAVKIFGKRRAQNLWAISANEIADKINVLCTKTIVMYGENEHQSSPNLVSRCQESAKRIKNSQLVEIANAPHDMADPIYSKAVVDLL